MFKIAMCNLQRMESDLKFCRYKMLGCKIQNIKLIFLELRNDAWIRDPHEADALIQDSVEGVGTTTRSSLCSTGNQKPRWFK